MSNTHGQMSRFGINLQAGKNLAAFPGWGSDFLASRTGNPAGWLGDTMSSAGAAPPRFAGDTPGGKMIISREFLHSLTNYPERAGQTYRYACDLEVGGGTTLVALTIWAASLARNSHKGLDQGARSGTVTIESLTLTYTDGTQQVFWPGQLVFDAMNGWVSSYYIHKWGNYVVGSKPVLRARLSVAVFMGWEEYHDADKWTPKGVIGHGVYGVGYDYGQPAGSVIGFVDRQNTYVIPKNSGVVAIYPPQLSIPTSGLYERIS